MEVYRVSNDSVKHFKTLFNQNGRGLDLDRYIYHQRGAGIGSFFAKLFHRVLPVAKSGESFPLYHSMNLFVYFDFDTLCSYP